MATVVERARSIAVPRAAPALPAAQTYLIHGVTWEGYESQLRVVGDRPIRVTYDRGSLELMSPSPIHEEFGHLFGLAVHALAEELDLPCRGMKSTTWRRELLGRGIEADECFYLANLHRVLGKRELNLDHDPPPDLAIEIEISRSALDRLGIYAALGVPEVWRFDGEALRVLVLQPDGSYVERDISPAFPFLPLAEVVRFVQDSVGGDHARWSKRFRAWVREAILPHHQPPDRPED